MVTVAEDQWRQAAYSAGISSSDQPRAIRQAFQRARQELVAAKQVNTQDGRYWLGGTKRNKAEHCSSLYPGIAVDEAEQSGTYPFRGCSSVPPSADTQSTPRDVEGNVPPPPLICSWRDDGRLITKCNAPALRRGPDGNVVCCASCGAGGAL